MNHRLTWLTEAFGYPLLGMLVALFLICCAYRTVQRANDPYADPEPPVFIPYAM